LSAEAGHDVVTSTAADAAVADPVASIRDLSVSFPADGGRVEAVRSVSLDIRAGEVIALVGESGSGKSVLGMSILGLITKVRGAQVSGEVSVTNVDMLGRSDRLRTALRRHVLGAVFQDPLTSLNPTMRIGNQLTERGISAARAVENLRDVGVPDPGDRMRQFPYELSGGLRQRVMIAMALGTAPVEGEQGTSASAEELPAVVVADARGTPRLIVADEPTTALDVSVQAQVVLLLDRLRREHGCAVLFVTHDLGVAASIADRIAVMYAGRLCEVGPTADVLGRPTHPYTRALLGARISVDAGAESPVRPIAGSPPDPTNLPSGCPFAPRCANARDDCREVLPPLTAKQDAPGEVACLHPHEGASRPAAVSPLGRPRGREASSRTEMALELAGVSKAFDLRGGGLRRSRQRLHAVTDVSLEIRRGRVLGLVGESGCGKTTTLRIACGLLAPDAGTVRWGDGGRPQLVFQDAGSSLTPWMRIGAMLEEQLRRAGASRREAVRQSIELLERVGLDERAAAAKPRMLSGGQRQRAAIARALASNPSVLVCDEPVSALDASLAIMVLDLLQSLRDDLGVALLVVTHDLGVARHIADEVAVMYRGQLVERGPTESVFKNPAHPYTEGLLAAIPTAEAGRLSPKLAGEPPSPVGAAEGCGFHPRCPYAQRVCRSSAPPLLEVDPDRRSACHFSSAVLAGDAQGRA
jgi:peptide/nickel transport system ATP-binding protein